MLTCTMGDTRWEKQNRRKYAINIFHNFTEGSIGSDDAPPFAFVTHPSSLPVIDSVSLIGFWRRGGDHFKFFSGVSVLLKSHPPCTQQRWEMLSHFYFPVTLD